MCDDEFVIRVQNLSKTYFPQQGLRPSIHDFLTHSFGKKDNSRSIEALRDVSFDIKAGESVGIIGSNGAGKSTLLKVLSGVTPPTSGKVILRGTVRSVLDVGTGFHPDLTGEENIFLSGEILGLTRNEVKERFNEIVDFSEISEFIKVPVKYYSSGMYLRLAFSTITFLQSDIVILDEAISAGDINFKKKLINRIKLLRKKGKTLVLVSHSFSEVYNLCTNVILLEDGRIKAQGPTHDIISSYMEHSVLKRLSSIKTEGSNKEDVGCLTNNASGEGQSSMSLAENNLDDNESILRTAERSVNLGSEKGVAMNQVGSSENDFKVGFKELSQFQETRKVWANAKTAPGNENLLVLSAALTGPNDSQQPYYVDEPLTIKLLVEKLSDKQSHLGVVVCGNMEDNLFAFSTALRDKTSSFKNIGKYKVEFQIPKNTLNKGIFEIKLVFSGETKNSITIEELLTFKMEYPKDMPDAEFMEQYPGPLRFDIPCRVTALVN